MSCCSTSNYSFKSYGIKVILLITAVYFCSLSLSKLSNNYSSSTKDEILYLPNGEALGAISFGYKNVVSDILWFNAINYFGKHLKSDRNYTYLFHMCNLVTNLDPKKDYAYEFCGLMLAWEAGLPTDSVEILTKATEHLPDNWKMFYLRGMTYLIFLSEPEKANQDFITSAKLPGAHPAIARIAAKKLSAFGNHEAAIEFLKERIESADEDWEKQLMFEKLKELMNKKND